MNGYKQRLSRFLDLAHIIKVSNEDLGYVAPQRPLEHHAATLLKRPNCRLVVITLGEEGSMALTAGGSIRSPIYPATPGGDNVGAGDTLMAGVLSWLSDHGALSLAALPALDDEQLRQMLWFGAVAAGINCSRTGANPPTRAEVERVLARA
jgi:fructokinase